MIDEVEHLLKGIIPSENMMFFLERSAQETTIEVAGRNG